MHRNRRIRVLLLSALRKEVHPPIRMRRCHSTADSRCFWLRVRRMGRRRRWTTGSSSSHPMVMDKSRPAPMKKWKGMWMSLPSGASTFLSRAMILFIAWKALYIMLLLPIGEPDGWLVRKLGESTVSMLNLVYGGERYRVSHGEGVARDVWQSRVPPSIVYSPGVRSDLGIGASCNGLELMALAVGFILCFQGTWGRKAGYAFASVVFVFMVNVVRCCLLAVIKTEHPVYFVFAHKYLFNLAGYGCIFLVWMRYVHGMARV
jgi:exosortase/archaeosortase family protein